MGFQKKKHTGHYGDLRYLQQIKLHLLYTVSAILQLAPGQLIKSFEVPRD